MRMPHHDNITCNHFCILQKFDCQWARSIQPKFPEISVQKSMDRFGPTEKVSKKLVHLLRWTTFPGRTGLNFGWIEPAQCTSVYLARKYYSCTCNNVKYPKSCLPPGREHHFTCSSEQHERLVICRAKVVSLYLRSLTLSLPEYLMEFCKATLTFESADEILWCDHSNESSLPVLSHDDICLSNF